MADTILALLEPGEYVINRNAAKKIGKEALDDLNYDMMPRFTNGGSILGEHLQGYQTGGPVSYGGYESDLPSLDDLYEQFGVVPNEENLKRFDEYDPSREGVYREDYDIAMSGLGMTGQRALGSAYEGTRSKGHGFMGSGFDESTLSKARKSMMQDYLQGQRGAFSTMFKGVRGERERWLTEMGSQLGALEEAGGTDKYKKPTEPYTGAPGDEDTGMWNPPENPSTGDSYMATNGQEYIWHFRDGWMAAEDFRSNYDFGSQREGAGGP